MDMPVLVSITQAKVRLEELIEGARGGEKIIICRRGKPAALAQTDLRSQSTRSQSKPRQ